MLVDQQWRRDRDQQAADQPDRPPEREPPEQVGQRGRPHAEQMLRQRHPAQVVADDGEDQGQEEGVARRATEPELELPGAEQVPGRQEVGLAVLRDKRRDPLLEE